MSQKSFVETPSPLYGLDNHPAKHCDPSPEVLDFEIGLTIAAVSYFGALAEERVSLVEEKY